MQKLWREREDKKIEKILQFPYDLTESVSSKKKIQYSYPNSPLLPILQYAHGCDANWETR